MTKGSRVRLVPEGGPPASGTVLMLSGNGLSIAVAVDDETRLRLPGLTLHPEFGQVLLATLGDGGWRDVFSDAALAIEEEEPC